MNKIDLNKPIRFAVTRRPVRIVDVAYAANRATLQAGLGYGASQHSVDLKTGYSTGGRYFENHGVRTSVFRTAQPSLPSADHDCYGNVKETSLAAIAKRFVDEAYPIFIEQIIEDGVIIDIKVHRNPNL